MAMLLDFIANAGIWGSIALLGWGAAICIGALSTSIYVDLPCGDAKVLHTRYCLREQLGRRT
jgi:hypothetical protein